MALGGRDRLFAARKRCVGRDHARLVLEEIGEKAHLREDNERLRTASFGWLVPRWPSATAEAQVFEDPTLLCGGETL